MNKKRAIAELAINIYFICQDILYKIKYICYSNLHKKINIKKNNMYTTQLDNGTLNNYAVEPKISYAEYPAVYEQRRYVIQGAIAALFVTSCVLVSFAVS
jgi:hypothetical protein